MESIRTVAEIYSLGEKYRSLAKRVFSSLDAQSFIDEFVVKSASTPFDLEETAKGLTLTVERGASMGWDLAEFKGTEGDGLHVRISEKIEEGSPAEHYAFAHELGHLFLLLKAVHVEPERRRYYTLASMNQVGKPELWAKIEDFCEYFASEVTGERPSEI